MIKINLTINFACKTKGMEPPVCVGVIEPWIWRYSFPSTSSIQRPIFNWEPTEGFMFFSTGAMTVHSSSSVTYSAPWASVTPLLAEDRFHSSNRKSSSSTNLTSVLSSSSSAPWAATVAAALQSPKTGLAKFMRNVVFCFLKVVMTV